MIASRPSNPSTTPNAPGPETSVMRLPDFLILGEMKCGTTTLWDALQQYGPVFTPQAKELHFFGSYAKFDAFGRYDRDGHDGLASYAAAFTDAPDHTLCGEATPNYLSDPGACRRIREALPDVRLVVILRDPVQRAWSHYWHQVRRGTETLDFGAALDAEPQRMAHGSDDDRMMFSYVTRGHYALHLRRYAEAFGRASLHVALLNDLTKHPARTVREVADHLGLTAFPDDHDDDTRTGLLQNKNRATYPKSPALDRWIRRLQRWADTTGPLPRRSAKWVADRTRPWRTYSGPPRMTDAQRQRLRAAFAESDASLADWLGRPLPWRSPDPPTGSTP